MIFKESAELQQDSSLVSPCETMESLVRPRRFQKKNAPPPGGRIIRLVVRMDKKVSWRTDISRVRRGTTTSRDVLGLGSQYLYPTHRGRQQVHLVHFGTRIAHLEDIGEYVIANSYVSASPWHVFAVMRQRGVLSRLIHTDDFGIVSPEDYLSPRGERQAVAVWKYADGRRQVFSGHASYGWHPNTWVALIPCAL